MKIAICLLIVLLCSFGNACRLCWMYNVVMRKGGVYNGITDTAYFDMNTISSSQILAGNECRKLMRNVPKLWTPTSDLARLLTIVFSNIKGENTWIQSSSDMVSLIANDGQSQTLQHLSTANGKEIKSICSIENFSAKFRQRINRRTFNRQSRRQISKDGHNNSYCVSDCIYSKANIGVNLPVSVIQASSQQSGFPVTNVLDGNSNTFFKSRASRRPLYIVQLFYTKASIVDIVLESNENLPSIIKIYTGTIAAGNLNNIPRRFTPLATNSDDTDASPSRYSFKTNTNNCNSFIFVHFPSHRGVVSLSSFTVKAVSNGHDISVGDPCDCDPCPAKPQTTKSCQPGTSGKLNDYKCTYQCVSGTQPILNDASNGCSVPVPVTTPKVTTPKVTTPKVTTPPPSQFCKSVCGLAPGYIRSFQPNIINGVDADRYEYPFYVKLLYFNRFICGASLISNQYVLTATHCLISTSANRFKVQLRNGNGYITYTVKKITRHPSYNSRTLANDIGIVELNNAVTFSNDRHPICLPESNLAYVNIQMSTIGFGLIDKTNNIRATTLQETTLTTITNAGCDSIYAGVQGPDTICARSSTSQICNGDSGSSLVHRENNRYVHVGTTSFADGGCTPGLPAGYSRTGYFLQWISDNIPNASCN